MNRLGKVQFKPAAGILGLCLLLASAVTLQAQQPDPKQPDPNMRAARLSYVEGDVQLSQGNQILAHPALANTPLFEGAEVAARADGRAEIQLDDGSIVRISPNSSVKIAVLRQDSGATKAELVLTSGLAYFELQGDSSADHTIARFGESTVTASGFTVLRVSLDNLPGEVAVFAGNAHIDRGSTLSLDLHGGESVALNAADPNLYNLSETIEPDSWDAWNADRDQDLTTQEAAKTAASGSVPNSNNPAWSDLDANGDWYNVPGQGYVWSPSEASSGSWDPYGCGNWVSDAAVRLHLGFLRTMGLSSLHKRILELLRRFRLGLDSRIRLSLVDNRRMGWEYRQSPRSLSAAAPSARRAGSSTERARQAQWLRSRQSSDCSQSDSQFSGCKSSTCVWQAGHHRR